MLKVLNEEFPLRPIPPIGPGVFGKQRIFSLLQLRKEFSKRFIQPIELNRFPNDGVEKLRFRTGNVDAVVLLRISQERSQVPTNLTPSFLSVLARGLRSGHATKEAEQTAEFEKPSPHFRVDPIMGPSLLAEGKHVLAGATNRNHFLLLLKM